VKLIAPQFVTPYVKSNKNDANDAEAICEAMGRPGMRFVTIKTVEQHDCMDAGGRATPGAVAEEIQAVHRIRSELVGQRTAKDNQIRGLVAEYGLVVPQQMNHLRTALPEWLEDAENGLSDRFRRLLNSLWGDFKRLDQRVTEMDSEIALIAQHDPVVKTPATITRCWADGRNGVACRCR